MTANDKAGACGCTDEKVKQDSMMVNGSVVMYEVCTDCWSVQ